MSIPNLTPEIAVVLTRYLELQAEEKRLKDEKKRLQEILGGHLSRSGLQNWYPKLEGRTVAINTSQRDSVQYDEGILRTRLGSRFPVILAPDKNKVAQYEPEVHRLLEPIIEVIGSVHRDKVRAAVDQGIVKREEFEGAFSRKKWMVISVRRSG